MNFNMSVFRAILDKWMNKANELEVVARASYRQLRKYLSKYDQLGEDEREAIINITSKQLITKIKSYT